MTTDEHRDIAGITRLGLAVGAELRSRREERNQTIRDVADVVRIQTRYIEALEEGRIDHLPGRVYALGFVRTYAEYLGLDPNDMVARFKQEAKGLESQSDLSMPEPIDEGKAPTAAIIIVAILLAGAAYSAWYFMSGPDSRVADIVPEVPERLAGLAAENALTEEAIAPAPIDDAVKPSVSASAQETEGAAAAAASPPAPEPETTAVVPAEPPEAPAPGTQTAAAPTPAIETPVPAPAPAPEPSAPASSAESTAAAARPPPAPPPVVARDPVVYGADNPDARVVITALEDAWIEVTDADGAILFSRVLRKGDRYQAPDRPGATFVTGNAGGLAIEVDGDPAPSLGPAGVVRKNVNLDADLLKAGRALP